MISYSCKFKHVYNIFILIMSLHTNTNRPNHCEESKSWRSQIMIFDHLVMGRWSCLDPIVGGFWGYHRGLYPWTQSTWASHQQTNWVMASDDEHVRNMRSVEKFIICSGDGCEISCRFLFYFFATNNQNRSKYLFIEHELATKP